MSSGEEREERSVTIEEILMDFFSRFRFFKPSPIRRNPVIRRMLMVLTNHSELEEILGRIFAS